MSDDYKVKREVIGFGGVEKVTVTNTETGEKASVFKHTWNHADRDLVQEAKDKLQANEK